MNKKNKSKNKAPQEENNEFTYHEIAYQMLTGHVFEKNKTTQTDVNTIYRYIENILAQIPVSVDWMNRDFVYLGCTNSMAKLLRLKSRHDIVGKTYADLFDEKSASYYKRADRIVMEKGTPLLLEEPLYHPDGKQEIYLSQKVPLHDLQGEIIGMLGVSVDITDRKKMEEELHFAKNQAETASQAKTEFLENMRHDIRTPLTGIVGFSDIIKSEAENPNIKEYADNLVASSHALLSLMDEVLEAVRVSSGEIPGVKKKFSLKKTLQHIIDLNKAKALSKHLDLQFDYDESLPNYVIGDNVRIHRVVLELVSNALNFTDTGFVTVKVEFAKKEDSKLIIKIIVKDSGIGIPPEKKQEIFLQFKRLTPSYQGIYKGAGLGLSVVKQFVDDIQGEIYVESQPNKGSIFTCIIPLQKPLLDDDSGVEQDDSLADDLSTKTGAVPQSLFATKESKESASKYRVLIIEDNYIAQIVAKKILAQLHGDSDIAETGKKAVELWKQNHYDLIFMDIGLPDLDGYEVTHLIRVQELTSNTHVPIIALTAHAGDENKKRCIDAGMNAVLTKPLTIKSCTDIVDAFIPGRHKEEMAQSTDHYLSDLPEHEEGLFNLSEFSTLDIEEGIKTTGNESMLAEMLTFMINDSLPNDLALMKAAYESHDWDKTQQLAHKIKGGAVYVGTIKIKMACQFLERYWKTGQRDLLEKLYHQAVATIEESMQEIKRWLGNQ
ncbi:ATP-binding protein [Legionella oakridgensis]|uniref:histidine kinase n=2 Tax=Legionella oakridgensis TaxID=29423 RepID=W0B5S5_9GAMM|nr:ATP-binding protein [Legionella oakridgensis]AHE65858.1 signal transduction histidine kinase [Legionella oakridgensis ATCC 33761 = DSM 21215]KTD37295.1 sensory histidine-kinase / response regulator [Legionella oakridgensis]STY15794.1 sensory histidine-kinase / response regulator [Legionella longbeachae]